MSATTRPRPSREADTGTTTTLAEVEALLMNSIRAHVLCDQERQANAEEIIVLKKRIAYLERPRP